MLYKYRVQDLVTIAICVALSVVLGKVLGLLHRIMPFSRGLVNAPFFSFMISLILYRVRRAGAISLYALGYGLLMVRFSVFATIAIIIGGIMADLITRIILGDYSSDSRIAIVAPIYSSCGIIASFFITTRLISSSLYNFGGLMSIIVSVILVYLAGLLGSFSALHLYTRRLRINAYQADDSLPRGREL